MTTDTDSKFPVEFMAKRIQATLVSSCMSQSARFVEDDDYEHQSLIESPMYAWDDGELLFQPVSESYRNRQLYLQSYKFTREETLSEKLRSSLSKFKVRAWVVMACNCKPVVDILTIDEFAARTGGKRKGFGPQSFLGHYLGQLPLGDVVILHNEFTPQCHFMRTRETTAGEERRCEEEKKAVRSASVKVDRVVMIGVGHCQNAVIKEEGARWGARRALHVGLSCGLDGAASVQ
ncbi:hypothetical protein L7F22_062251 [Adiantum nelumboides]|nr:hypothetical protein [Adiantum nelumboides]